MAPQHYAKAGLSPSFPTAVAAGETVICLKLITRTFPEGAGTQELTMIYEVNAGRIVRAWTILGAKTVVG